MRMRILLLTDFYLPTVGGIERHVALLGEHLTARGHEVAVCTVRQPNSEPFESNNGLEVHRLESLFLRMPLSHLDAAKRYHPPFTDPQITAGLRELVKEFKPDIIHSHGWMVFSYLPLKKRMDIPVIATLHNFGFICPRQDFFLDSKGVCATPLTAKCFPCSALQYGKFKAMIMLPIVKRNLRSLSQIDRFLAVSTFVRDTHMRFLDQPSDRISRLPNFCDGRTENGSDVSGILPEDFILYVGPLAPHKGIDVLIKAYHLARVDIPLVILGTKHLAFDYGKFEERNRIIVFEDPPRNLVVRALEKCRFIVLPSICADACPTVLIEAMKYGKAAIASRVGGIPDLVVDNETGLLVLPGDASSLAGAMQRMAGMEGECNELGERARSRFAEYFTVEKVVQDLESIYQSTVHFDRRNIGR